MLRSETPAFVPVTPAFAGPPSVAEAPPPVPIAPTRSRAAILQRHAGLAGRLRSVVVRSAALGLAKRVYVYEPPGGAAPGLPLLWLFRGHEREWVNAMEDTSRQRGTAIEDLDRAIATGRLPPMTAVMPGLTSANNHVHSAGLDMTGPLPPLPGLGTGRFWTYLADELLPRFAARLQPSMQVAFGFSLGGYVVSLLATRRPGLLDHACFYDALFCWPEHDDPRRAGHQPFTDAIWTKSPVFDPALGPPPRPRGPLRACNTTDALLGAPPDAHEAMRRTTFWLRTAGGDGQRGNRDRGDAFAAHLRGLGLRLGYESTVLAPFAAHAWHWNDVFFGETLLNIFSPVPCPPTGC